jgi:hypothetical protein
VDKADSYKNKNLAIGNPYHSQIKCVQMSNPVQNLVQISEEDGHVNQKPAQDALTEQATQLMLMMFFLLHTAKDALNDLPQ